MKWVSVVGYYLFLQPVSRLPVRVLFLFSDLLYLVLFKLLKYRTAVVYSNLKNSFPEKPDIEIRKIMDLFYQHFCDIVIEGVKSFSMSESELQKRVTPVNTELLESIFDSHRSVLLCTGHFANWEWPALAFYRHSQHKPLGIYLPLKNKFMDRKVAQTRSKFGLTLISVKEVSDYFEMHKDELCSYGFIFDQSPSNPAKAHWIQFLNQDTPVMMGVEYYARKHNLPVVYGKIKKQRRGYYSIQYELVTAEPMQEQPNAIIEKIYSINEKLILEKPQHWLWTHRRWKHKRPVQE